MINQKLLQFTSFPWATSLQILFLQREKKEEKGEKETDKTNPVMVFVIYLYIYIFPPVSNRPGFWNANQHYIAEVLEF